MEQSVKTKAGIEDGTETRIKNIQESMIEDTILRTGRNVLAPVMVEFVSWVLTQAQKDGISRLYFLARDGYPMYLCAKILAPRFYPGIECRYLKCSRYSLRIPSFSLKGKESIHQICIGGIDVTLHKILKRAGLTQAQISQIAVAIRQKHRLHDFLTYQEVVRLKKVLLDCPLFWEYVYAHSKEAYHDTVGYLRQEGLLDPIPYAVADSGWTGSIQQTLLELLQSAGYKGTPSGYYFGLYELPCGADHLIYHAYYFIPRGRIQRKAYFSNSLLERDYSAPHGMTLGYAFNQESGKYEAVLMPGENPNYRWQKLIYKSIARAARCAEAKTEGMKTGETSTDTGEGNTERLLSRLMGHPTAKEAEAFGSFVFTDDVLEKGQQTVAADLTQGEIRDNHFLRKALLLSGIKKGRVRESAWIEGSIVRGGRKVGWHLLQARLYKYILYFRKQFRRKL